MPKDAMPHAESMLPRFIHPPIREAIFVVEFAPLSGWGIQHFGLLWERLREDYPTVVSAPPLPPPMQNAAPVVPGTPALIQFAIGGEVGARCVFFHTSGSRLIQVQADRFALNWHKEPDDHYPGYSELRPLLEHEWSRFCQFLREAGLPAPVVKNCDIQYINHLDEGEGWTGFDKLKDVVRCWKASESGASDILPPPSKVAMDVIYTLPEGVGTLRVGVQPATRLQDGKQILQLAFSARGRPQSNEIADVLDWMDQGHRWVVQGFDAFTSPEMHKIWGKEL